MSNEENKNQPEEKEEIVSLNEDSKSHQHDAASYEKLMNEQKAEQAK
jgi:hypothetical protein